MNRNDVGAPTVRSMCLAMAAACLVGVSANGRTTATHPWAGSTKGSAKRLRMAGRW